MGVTFPDAPPCAKRTRAPRQTRGNRGFVRPSEARHGELTTARPVQAALTSAATFALGAALPLAMVFLVPQEALVVSVSIGSLVFLALLGAIGARAGGANVGRATLRVTFWGALAMALTAGIGAIFRTIV